MNKSISIANLIVLAADLKSDDGDNKEYDRALCELVGRSQGKMSEEFPEVAKELGIPVGVLV